MHKLATALLAFAVALPAFAQAPAAQPFRIRGTIEAINGDVITAKARSGQTYQVRLISDKLVVMGIHKASIADLQSGKYIGTTSVGEQNGNLVAHAIHIFPENMRGTGEGHRDWDLRPDSKMTNAAVADVVKMGADQVLTVKYKDGEKKVLVTPKTSVVSFQLADRSELKPGAQIFINNVDKAADGSLSTARINVGMNGQVPPM